MSLTIGELSVSSGVPVVTLRDWDRRHGLSPSQRTIGNHRRYTESDAALVVRVRELVASGLRLRAAVPQARAEHQVRVARSRAVAHAMDEHQRVHDTISASRGATIARRDRLVAERVALTARRKALARSRPTVLDAAHLSDQANVAP